MTEQGLVSKYTIPQFSPKYPQSAFDQDQELKIVVSDLTYVRIGDKWYDICRLVELYNREIIGHSAGHHKMLL